MPAWAVQSSPDPFKIWYHAGTNGFLTVRVSHPEEKP